MKFKLSFLTVVLAVGFISLTAFTSSNETEYKPLEKTVTNASPWDGYRTWSKITKGNPNTGDPTGFVAKRHNGKSGFRDIYINDIGAAVQQGHAPYKYPEGTVLVKEAYKSLKALEKGSKFVLTVMIKQKAGSSPETGDWGYIMGAKGKLSTGTSKWAKFCTNCHVFAASSDYVFMHADFIASLKK